MKKNSFLTNATFAFMFIMVLFSACNKDDNNNANTNTGLKALSTQYLICANRNPGGVGFDFEYDGKTGGANNIDSLSVTGFTEDIIVKTIKADNNGTAGAINFIALHNGAQAVNYSIIDTNCVGLNCFKQLSYDVVLTKKISFTADDNSFNLTGLATGTSGAPLLTEVSTQIKKLVIGNKWLTTAKNDIANDEIIWIIKTAEDRWVKFIVFEFPASNAPTANGYVNIDWAFLN